MPLRTEALLSYAPKFRSRGPRSLTEARALGATTGFLCHSHRDAALARGFAAWLADVGCAVYIDWLDPGMPERPDRMTAERIKLKIASSGYFFFLATDASMASRWCPWEIGYADGVKAIDRILLVQTLAGTTTYGSEYLDLYRSVDLDKAGVLGVWEPGQTTSGIPVASL
jgi:hypothetical protein